MKDLINMTDVELLDSYDKARRLLSYHNAAESSWSSETTARNKATRDRNEILSIIESRKLTPNEGNYLC